MVSAVMTLRGLDLVAATIRQIDLRAQLRLSHRHRRLKARGLQNYKICVAIARELAGFIWDIGRHVGPTA